MIRRLAIACLLFSSITSTASADDVFVTEEFKTGSRVSMVYICGVAGEKFALDPSALETLAFFVQRASIPAHKSGQLLNDAVSWWDANIENYDPGLFWENQCATPYENMRGVQNGNSK
jgi:hypothetical protein